MNLLSVIMPTHNGGEYVAAALESVAGQHSEIELIVVDDGSTDSTVEIVREFALSFPVQLITPGRLGNWVAATNVGLRRATGEWVSFLHQDDFWLPGRIAKLRPALEASGCALVLHNSAFVGPDGKKIGLWTCPLDEGLVPSNQFVERLLVQNFIAIPAPIFRREAVVSSGGLDEGLWFSADWDLWLRLGALGPVRFVAEALTAFRIHQASQTASRWIAEGEWERQLTTVLSRHLSQWQAPAELHEAVERAAKFSIDVNCALSALSRGQSAKKMDLFIDFLALGPRGWSRYFHDSRIAERVVSRLKVGSGKELPAAQIIDSVAEKQETSEL